MPKSIDFPVISLPNKYVTAGAPDGNIYASFLHKSSVNQNVFLHKAGERDAVMNSGLLEALAADIEANYKSLAYPTCLPIALINDIKNGGLLFVGTSSGTAGEVVVIHAATASTAAVAVSVSSNTATITLSDTASINTANNVVTAWNAASAATAKASISLYRGTLADGTSRNNGTGIVSTFADTQLLQSNTYGLFGHIRMASALLSMGHNG